MKKNCISTTKIAEICGVSQGTVDRAINNRKGINPATKEKILQVAKEYGYRPNIHARCIVGGKSQLIGVIVFDLKNQYFNDMLTNVEKFCTLQGYSTVVMFSNKDSKTEIECIKNLYHISVDGIILCPINSGEEYENFLLSLNIPIITFGNKLDSFPFVGIDNTQAMEDVTNHITKKGYKKLIYVKPRLSEKNTFAQSTRLASFTQICRNAGIEYFITEPSGAENLLNSSERCAIICPTDVYAIKLLSIAQKYNAGIIGFDNISLIDELGLKLDSVAYDADLTAKNACEYIINGIYTEKPVIHKIITRGST